MRIPNEVRKTVAFLGYRDLITGELKPVGSTFFVAPPRSAAALISPPIFAVTAWHVIAALRAKGCISTFVRMNGRQGGVLETEVPIAAWHRHPDDNSIDVAVVPFVIRPQADHLALAYELCATPDVLDAHEIGLGDEVIISGLFRHHYGTGRNIPIVRTGNLAALNEERVATPEFGDIEAYLIEARSIGGLSGSPVFANMGAIRMRGGVASIGGPQFFLLGLIHGHFDVALARSDVLQTDAGLKEETVNAGIAIVVPFDNILATIDTHPSRAPFTPLSFV